MYLDEGNSASLLSMPKADPNHVFWLLQAPSPLAVHHEQQSHRRSRLKSRSKCKGDLKKRQAQSEALGRAGWLQCPVNKVSLFATSNLPLRSLIPFSTQRTPSIDPLLPLYVRHREQRARPPKAVEHQGHTYDVMGASPNGDLLLRDTRAVQQDVRVECFPGRLAVLDEIEWLVLSMEPIIRIPLDTVLRLRLVDPKDPSRTLTMSGNGLDHIKFPCSDGDGGYNLKIGPVKHGIVRMSSTVPRANIRRSLRCGQRFEARLKGAMLDGPFTVRVGASGQLIATNTQRGYCPSGSGSFVIRPEEIAPRYKRVQSLDFGGDFDVDAFFFVEDQLRGRMTSVDEIDYTLDLGFRFSKTSLFGTLPVDTSSQLTNGADQLSLFEDFIRRRAIPPSCFSYSNRAYNPKESAGLARKLTIINLSMSNQGKAESVLDAVVYFRQHNPGADIVLVVSKLGPSDFQLSPDFHQYLDILSQNRVHVDMYTGVDGPTRQVNHAKGIVIDDEVLFSTGSVMDTQPINKADFSVELPIEAATAFRRYNNEAILGDATNERRAELGVELARRGVVINDPIAGLTYISRVQDILIRGARRCLVVSVSELVDSQLTKLIVARAARGVKVTLQVREIDPASSRIIRSAIRRYSDAITMEDVSCWEPRPHYNVIIADDRVGYLGSSYLWPTQRNMVHQGRSFENGVLLEGDAVARVSSQLEELRVLQDAATRSLTCVAP